MTENEENKDFQDDIESVLEDTFEEAELEDLEENSKDTIKKLKEKIKACEKEKAEHLENLQRAKAEFLNARKRLDEEKIQDRERAIVGHIERLLPLADSFFIAMSNKEAWETATEGWRKGIESVNNQLQSLLKSYGVSEVNPTGEVFDPEIHEALTNVTVTEKEKHDTVVGVIQNGFVRTANGKTTSIRPARVTVGEFKDN